MNNHVFLRFMISFLFYLKFSFAIDNYFMIQETYGKVFDCPFNSLRYDFNGFPLWFFLFDWFKDNIISRFRYGGYK